MRYLLVHSPLVGPSTLAPLAKELEDRGHDTVLPDLRDVVDEPRPSWLIDQAVAHGQTKQIDVAVAHSGSGAVLPSISAAVGTRVAIFLDAVLPEASSRVHVTPEGQRALLEEHAEAGLLRPWLSWWPPDLVDQMLPDAHQRRRLEQEQRRLPLSFYDHDIALPPDWVPSGFIALGRAYLDELSEAQRRGWPTRQLALTHLAPATHPRATADAVASLVDEFV